MASYYILKLITLLGGLALFLFGMDVMGKALERQAGGKLQTILSKMSSTVFKGFLLGLGVTAVIQSSSATTVMVVGFVNSGIMTLKQAVGVIMGANIGTTATAWILSLSGLEGDSLIVQLLKPSTLAPLAGVVGIILFLFTKSDQKKGIGTIMLGFMALMTGMDIMGDAMGFLQGEPWFAQLMISFSNPVVGILFGAVLTAILQSSSASIGILQGLCNTGVVTYGAALPIILGQNIGTCVTAMMGAIGANRNARRTAVMHLLFNVSGVAIFVVLFYGLEVFLDWKFLSNTAAAWDVAVIHTCFNLAATAVLMPMNGLLVKLACVLVPDIRATDKTELLDTRLVATPAVAVRRALEVAGQMAEATCLAMELASKLTISYDQESMDRVVALEQETDHYQDAIGSFLIQLSDQRLSVKDNRVLNTLLYTISDMERICDHALHVAKAAREMKEKRILFSPQAQNELSVLQRAVNDIIRRTVESYATLDVEQAMKVEPHEQVIDLLVREIKSRHVRRLRDCKCSVECGFILEELLTAYARSADHCSNVAVELLQVADGKLEAHEYLNSLKAGRLRESARFSQRFFQYKDQYTLPEEA